MRLTENFRLEEFTDSQTAVRMSIDNTPSSGVRHNLLRLAEALEYIRLMFGGHPIRISSGYRCQDLNEAVGGSASSAHMLGLAVDFTCPDYGTPLEIARVIERSKMEFDQVIMEGTWVHLAIAGRQRRQVLTATFTRGVAQYAPGLPAA